MGKYRYIVTEDGWGIYDRVASFPTADEAFDFVETYKYNYEDTLVVERRLNGKK